MSPNTLPPSTLYAYLQPRGVSRIDREQVATRVPPSSCILTRQNEAIEPVASRRVHLVRLLPRLHPSQFRASTKASAHDRHFAIHSFHTFSLTFSRRFARVSKFNEIRRIPRGKGMRGEGQERENTIGERNYKGFNDTDDSASYPAWKRGVLPERSKRERNAGLKSAKSEPAGRTKGIVIPRPSVPVSCLRERNKIV